MRDNLLRLGLATLALLLGLWTSEASAQSRGEDLDFGAVSEELDRYGRWYEHPRYGRVWAPEVDRSWRPYTRGQWVNTEDYGWYWESEEPFGWAVYHYGRWFLDDRYGWSWVPGSEWGPAWVAWRTSDEDVGWAALPPEAEYIDGQLSFAERYYDSPRFSPAWCFVPVGLLVAPRIWERIAPSSRNGLFLGRTRFEPFERSHRGHYFNRGIEPKRWERVTGFRVDTRPTVSVNRFREAVPGRGGAVQIYRPRVTSTPPPGRPAAVQQPQFERRGNPRTWPSDQQHQAAPTQRQPQEAPPPLSNGPAVQQPQFERRGNPRTWPSDQQHKAVPSQPPPSRPAVAAPAPQPQAGPRGGQPTQGGGQRPPAQGQGQHQGQPGQQHRPGDPQQNQPR
ncbi:MAG: hypothetical protein JSS20_14020 [Proteobacteria bacterium]|nr:hypothetical protein [Pseudomonadota bacterium]